MIIDARNFNKSNLIIWGGEEFFCENYHKIDKLNAKYLFIGNQTQEDNPYYKGFKILRSIEEIKKVENAFVLIAKGMKKSVASIADILITHNIQFDYIGNYFSSNIYIDYLQAMHVNKYFDKDNNCVEINSNGKDVGKFVLTKMNTSKNNYLYLGNVKSKKESTIFMIGDGGKCRIEDGTTIEQVEITINSSGEVNIGKDCLFSYGIVLMQTDHHHIFDLETGKRINVNKNINIGNHVWIGRDVELLGGAEVGNNSVVGAGSVSSKKFGENCIIAGSPASVIRENIIWSEDAIRKGSLENFDQAKDKRGLKYL